MTTRVAIIGLNHYHVTGWTESLAQLPDRVEVVARYDKDRARAAATVPDFFDPSLASSFPIWMDTVPFYSTIDDVITSARPDVALVTLPNRDAPEAIDRLARSGVHMLVDKPGAIDARQATSAFETARKAGVKTAIAFTRRYGHPWQETAKQIRAGRLGSLLAAEAMFVTSSVEVRNPANHIFNRRLMGGGILHWLGVHDIDLFHWLADVPIDQVQAMGATRTRSDIDVEDTISVSFRCINGAMGTMHFAYALPRSGGDGYLALRGSKASVQLGADGTIQWIGSGSVTDPLLTESSRCEVRKLPGYGTVGAVIIADLLDAIANDRDPLATGEHAIAALQVIDAIYESNRTGQVVSVPASHGGAR